MPSFPYSHCLAYISDRCSDYVRREQLLIKFFFIKRGHHFNIVCCRRSIRGLPCENFVCDLFYVTVFVKMALYPVRSPAELHCTNASLSEMASFQRLGVPHHPSHPHTLIIFVSSCLIFGSIPKNNSRKESMSTLITFRS